MSKFKPIVIDFNEQAYNHAIDTANEKIELYNQALAWAGKHIKVDAPKAFADSFTEYFKEQFYQANKNKIQLNVSVDKILSLMDVETDALSHIEILFKENPNTLTFKDGIPNCAVDKEQFKRYTKSAKENEVYRAGKNYIDALERLSKYTHVYKQTASQAVSHLVRFDMRNDRLFVDVGLSGRFR